VVPQPQAAHGDGVLVLRPLVVKYDLVGVARHIRCDEVVYGQVQVKVVGGRPFCTVEGARKATSKVFDLDLHRQPDKAAGHVVGRSGDKNGIVKWDILLSAMITDGRG